MTEVPFSDLAPAEAAARWRVRLDDPDATEADWLAYETWLTAAPEHQQASAALDSALIDAELAADQIRSLDARVPDASPEAERGTVVPLRPKRPRAAAWWGAAAAIAAGTAFLMLRPPLDPTLRVTTRTYEAPATRDETIRLADGSQIRLNRRAAVEVAQSPARRAVTLLRGEAAFTVAHDAARPFEVLAGDARVVDVGTEFNVARDGHKLVVTVRSGVVDLHTRAAAPKTLRAGMQARVERGTVRVAAADPDAALAWTEGHLVFRDAPMSEVVSDLNRYSDRPIRLEGGDASRFSGVLMIDETDRMLDQLQQVSSVRVAKSRDGFVVKAAPAR